MKIFLSYASEDKAIAEPIAFSLRSRGHLVFLDRDDLPPGQSYDQQIERAIKESDLLIFLVSPLSVAQGRYTLTELAFARRKWPSPSGRVLPVLARKTPIDDVPSYLRAVLMLEPLGNIAAETAAAVDDLARDSDARRLAWKFAAVGAVAGPICALLPTFYMRSIFGSNILGYAPDAGLLYGLFLAVGIYKFTPLKTLRRLAFVPFVVAAIWLPTLAASQHMPSPITPSYMLHLDDPDLQSKLDEQTREMLRQSIRDAGTFNNAIQYAALLAGLAAIAALASLALLAALRFVFTLPASMIDVWWSGGLGLVAGLLFWAFTVGPDLGPLIKLYGQFDENTFGLISTPNFMLAYAGALAAVAASVGHWLGRTAE